MTIHRRTVVAARYSCTAVAVSATVLALLAGPAVAGPRGRVAVQPHQIFGGSVNDTTSDATIAMGCFGPSRPGQTGHPLRGQHLAVFIPEALTSPAFGDTGRRGHRIVARIVTDAGRSAPVATFTRFTRSGAVYTASRSLPTSVRLPCAGTGTVVFTPVPHGTGAKSATVAVNFTGQP
jgi:hypothetical protein